MDSIVFPAIVPALVVFDLDYTLWPFWVDTHYDLPFKKLSNGKVIDRRKREMKLHEDVVPILQAIKAKGIKIAAASRTESPPDAKALLKLYDIDKYFDYKEIYPGKKTTHFKRFQDAMKVPYEDMLFFDDEGRNIRDIGAIGVTCIFIDEDIGLTKAVFEDGLQQFAKNKSKKTQGL
ncbi:magnesium-dependent phosphatase 1-like [Ptychodera flava]|uniref:magnesium-dependent phosphatase 1-like n=1 Tax=Ptychodera flava TaxID=63121 RepID=UPI00396AACD0